MSTDSRPAQGDRDLSTLDRADIPLVLMYHAVADADHDPNALAVGPEQFAVQMAWLARRGLRGVGMRTLVAALRAGDTRNLVGITFDDGYLSVLENALPVLKRHQFTATVFVISDRLGATNEWDADTPWPLLSAAQVGELAAAGLEIGSHSATHIRLAGADADQLATEVSGSRQRLREVTETEIRGVRLPLREHGRRRPARGPRRGLRLRLRGERAPRRAGADGTAPALRRPARRRRPDDRKKAALPSSRHIAVKGTTK